MSGLLSSVIHEPDTKSAYMYQMWVALRFRGRGVGTALVNTVRSWAADKGMETLLLSVTTINTDAYLSIKWLQPDRRDGTAQEGGGSGTPVDGTRALSGQGVRGIFFENSVYGLRELKTTDHSAIFFALNCDLSSSRF